MIAFIDVETTSLDEFTGHLLEVAIIVTDDNLVERGHLNQVVKPVGFDIADVQMPLFVREMHEKSGLLVDVARIGVRRHEAEDVFVTWLECLFGNLDDIKNVPVAGNTIGFDRRWLREHMPKLEGPFSHRSIDVSSINECARRWAPSWYASRPKAGSDAGHRALDDIRHSVETLKHYRKMFADADKVCVGRGV